MTSSTTARGAASRSLPALLQVPELARRVADLGTAVRFESGLPPELAEVAILVVAHHLHSEYEAFAHARMAMQAGVDAAAVKAILSGEVPELPDPVQQDVHDYAVELLEHNRVSDATHDSLVAHLGDERMVELAATLGYFRMVSTLLNAYDVPAPPEATAIFEGTSFERATE